MFWQYNFQDRWQNNLGVGGTTLAEAGAQTAFPRGRVHLQSPRESSRPSCSRSSASWSAAIGRPRTATSMPPDVVVTDAFTGGGAQADRLSTEFHTSITWLLTQTIRKHTLKYGFNIPDWSRRGLSDRTNQIGTLSFASLADLAANRPFAGGSAARRSARHLHREERRRLLSGRMAAAPRVSRSPPVCATTGRTTSATATTSPRGWRSPTRPASRRRTVIRAGARFLLRPLRSWSRLRHPSLQRHPLAPLRPERRTDPPGPQRRVSARLPHQHPSPATRHPTAQHRCSSVLASSGNWRRRRPSP